MYYSLSIIEEGLLPISYINLLTPITSLVIRLDIFSNTSYVTEILYIHSQAFAHAHENYNIEWSMSRAGTPTEIPKIEALNGWIKDALKNDFDLLNCTDINKLVKNYIYYFNDERYSYFGDTKTQFKIELNWVIYSLFTSVYFYLTSSKYY